MPSATGKEPVRVARRRMDDEMQSKLARMEDAITSLPSESEIAAMAASIEKLLSALDELNRVLRGFNGTPGLISRVDRLEDTERTCPIGRVNTVLMGTEDKPGVLERMRQLEKFQASFEKLSYAVITAIVIDVAFRIISLVYK
jgi:hypothetical protein